MSQNYSVFQQRQNETIKPEIKKEAPQNSLAVCNKLSEVRIQMAEFSKRHDDFKERARLAREEVIRDYNEAVEKELEIVEQIMKSKEESFEEMKAKWDVKYKRDRKPCHVDESVLRKHFEDMGIIMEEENYVEEYLNLNINLFEDKELNNKVLKTAENVDIEEERQELLNNISCEENILCSESTSTIQCNNRDETVPIEEKNKDNSKDATDEDGIVLIDTDSYEEYLTTNEDEDEATIPNNFDINYCELANYIPDTERYNAEENVLERSGESYEEYFTTNGEDSEEYDERTDVKYEELVNISVDDLNYAQVIENLGETADDKERMSEGHAFEESEDECGRLGGNRSVAVSKEKPIIKRNVTCSLEMQLAKKSD